MFSEAKKLAGESFTSRTEMEGVEGRIEDVLSVSLIPVWMSTIFNHCYHSRGLAFRKGEVLARKAIQPSDGGWPGIFAATGI
jgi:hypothetical protein